MDTIEKYEQFVTTSMVASIEPIVVDHADGATVVDASGRSYIDCFAGIAVTNAGHRHPKVVEAAKAQIDKYVHAGSYIYYLPVVADLAQELAKITPGKLQKTFFANSGAEGIETALRLAKSFTGRSEFIALTHGFHGRTVGTLSITGNQLRKKHGGPYLPGIAFAPAPYAYRNPFGTDDPDEVGRRCAEMVDWAIRYQTSGNVAAFIAEPVMGEGGIIVPPSAYFKQVKEVLDPLGILFIADEVQSGFGRTGKLFAIEHFDVEPDILVMAKGIADGFPISATIARAEIADSFQPGEHLSTFGGNPVSCAAALANIEVMREEDLPGQAATKGNQVMAQLRELAGEHEPIGDVRGLGLMIGAELVTDRQTKEPANKQAAALKAFCREQGVLIGVGGQGANVLRIQPPLTISEKELERSLEVIGQGLEAVARE
ncbi:MAG TPA: aspartate aminotransferase family protein [Thermomicrobiaceae bacterium]|nr:aspartate aminotransferase family protein [Thermomicrobiaceae bacterium]